MHKINLIDTEKYILEVRHKATRDSRECDGIKSVLLGSESWSAKMISQVLRISPATVVTHLNDYIAELIGTRK